MNCVIFELSLQSFSGEFFAKEHKRHFTSGSTKVEERERALRNEEEEEETGKEEQEEAILIVG